MRDNYLHYLKEKKQVEEEKGRTYIETINELEKKKKSIENVNPYQKLLVRGALSSLVEAT